MGRGHWRLEDLQDRILRIHVMGGELDVLIEEGRARLAAEPSDVDQMPTLGRPSGQSRATTQTSPVGWPPICGRCQLDSVAIPWNSGELSSAFSTAFASAPK